MPGGYGSPCPGARAEIAARISAKRLRRAELLQQSQEQDADGVRTHVSALRLSDDDIVELQRILETPEFAGMKLAPPQGQSGWAPSAPEEHGRDIYEAQIRDMQPDQAPPKPWWRKYVCAGQNRDRFRDAVFECTIGDDVSHWLNIWLSPGRSHIYKYICWPQMQTSSGQPPTDATPPLHQRGAPTIVFGLRHKTRTVVGASPAARSFVMFRQANFPAHLAMPVDILVCPATPTTFPDNWQIGSPWDIRVSPYSGGGTMRPRITGNSDPFPVLARRWFV